MSYYISLFTFAHSNHYVSLSKNVSFSINLAICTSNVFFSSLHVTFQSSLCSCIFSSVHLFYSAPEKKEIPPYEVVFMMSDILLEQLKAQIALQKVDHKLELVISQMEKVDELLRRVLRCLNIFFI